MCDISEIIKDIYLLSFYERKFKKHIPSSSEELIRLREVFQHEIDETNDYNPYHGLIEEVLKEKFPIIYEMLLIGNGKISLVGPSILDIMFCLDENFFDFDIYVHSCNLEEANILIRRCLELLDIIVDYMVDHVAISFIDANDEQYSIRISLSVFEDKSSLLMSLPIPGRHGYDPVSKYFSTFGTALTLAIKSYPYFSNPNTKELEKYGYFGFLPISLGKVDRMSCHEDIYGYGHNLVVCNHHRCPSFVLRIPKIIQNYSIFLEMQPLIMYKNIVKPTIFPKNYIKIKVGIDDDRYVALSNIRGMFNIPNDMFQYICYHWLIIEALAIKQKYLLKLE